MTTPIQNLHCPRCGAARCQPVRGRRDGYACASCGAQFRFSDDSGSGAQLRMVHGADAIQAGGLRGFKWVFVALAAVLAVGVAMALLVPRHRPAAPAVARDAGQLQTAALVENSGKISYVRVMELREAEQAVFQVLVTELQTGKRLSEPQRFAFPRAGGSRRPELRQFSDGQLYLVLNERQLLRFDPGAQQFVDLSARLAERFPQQLGAGVAKLQFAYQDRPDALEVTSSEGGKFYVHWLTDQIVADRDAGTAYREAVAGYRHERSHYRFAPTSPKTGDATPYLLVRYWMKAEPGRMQYLGYFDLYPAGHDKDERSRWKDPEVGSGWAVRPYVVSDYGLLRLEAVPPATKRFHAQVLAENATRLLLAYSPTPVQEEGRVLQLLDKASHQVVWSRTAEQIPQLGTRGGGSYAIASALPSGFFISQHAMQPALLIDNDGNTVHDFTVRAGG
ncbi:MAG: hypothetical protein ACN6O3_04955 [Comamonas sp.]